MGTFEILLIEDSQADATILREILKTSPIATHLNVVTEWSGALDFLSQAGEFTSAPRPHLIMLDLNLPKTDGAEILAQLKEHDELKEIPVVVFSSSRRKEEVRQCYRLHANCFITKPQDLASLRETIRSILNFWFHTVVLPEVVTPTGVFRETRQSF